MRTIKEGRIMPREGAEALKNLMVVMFGGRRSSEVALREDFPWWEHCR
jgi:hypothetical protein